MTNNRIFAILVNTNYINHQIIINCLIIQSNTLYKIEYEFGVYNLFYIIRLIMEIPMIKRDYLFPDVCTLLSWRDLSKQLEF